MYFTDNCPVCGHQKAGQHQALIMPFVSEITEIWRPFAITKSEFYDLAPGMSYFSTYSMSCEGCGLIYAKHRFDQIELEKLYSNYRGEHYNQIRKKHEPRYEACDIYLAKQISHLKQIEKLISKFKSPIRDVLDWGGGEGLNTPFQGSAELVVSYDVSRREEFRVLKNECQKLSGSQTTYDLIACMHVLEHVNNPQDLVKSILKYLKPDGIVYFEVPLESGIDFELGGYLEGFKKTHWHEHINCFTKGAFEKLLYRSNLNLLHLNTYDVSDEFRVFKIIQCIAQKNDFVNINSNPNI